MMNKILSIAFVGALLSALSLVQAREIVFDNRSGYDLTIEPNYDSYGCRTEPFNMSKSEKQPHKFDAGTFCYAFLRSIDIHVPGNTAIKGISVEHELSSIPTGTSHILIKEANNALAATVTN